MMSNIIPNTSSFDESTTTVSINAIKGISVDEITDADVLCGKDFKTLKNHPGNTNFRKLLIDNIDQYNSSSSNNIRSKIIKRIVDTVKNTNGGRFLTKPNKTINEWYEITIPKKEYDKVSHAFRTLRKQINEGKLILDTKLDDTSKDIGDNGGDDDRTEIVPSSVSFPVNNSTTNTTSSGTIFNTSPVEEVVLFVGTKPNDDNGDPPNEMKRRNKKKSTKKKKKKKNPRKGKKTKAMKESIGSKTIINNVPTTQYPTMTSMLNDNDSVFCTKTSVSYCSPMTTSTSTGGTISNTTNIHDDNKSITNHDDDDNSSIERFYQYTSDIISTPSTKWNNVPIMSFDSDEDPINISDDIYHITIGSLSDSSNTDNALVSIGSFLQEVDHDLYDKLYNYNGIDDNDDCLYDRFPMELSFLDDFHPVTDFYFVSDNGNSNI